MRLASLDALGEIRPLHRGIFGPNCSLPQKSEAQVSTFINFRSSLSSESDDDYTSPECLATPYTAAEISRKGTSPEWYTIGGDSY